MIEIKNLQPTEATGFTFDAVVDDQLIEGCRASQHNLRWRIVLPPAAARIDWGDASIAEIETMALGHIKTATSWTRLN